MRYSNAKKKAMHTPPRQPANRPKKSDSSDDDTPQSSSRRKYDVVDNSHLSARMKLLLEKLNRYYQNGEFERTVLPIIRDKNPLAVRDIDWLVTNYSKAFPVVYPNPMHQMGEPFNVHESYEQHELGKGVSPPPSPSAPSAFFLFFF